MRPQAEIIEMIDALDNDIREHGWEASVDAAMRALEWAIGSPFAREYMNEYMKRPDTARRREWIARGGNPEHWPEKESS